MVLHIELFYNWRVLVACFVRSPKLRLHQLKLLHILSAAVVQVTLHYRVARVHERMVVRLSLIL